MKFQKIEGFKQMTNEAMAKVTGGDGSDSTTIKKPVLTDTTHVPTATSTLISDGKGGKMNTFDHMD